MNQPASGEPPILRLEECPYCLALVPVGAFCGNCGAHLAGGSTGRRLHAYAASPGEHVARPAVISTLFPHLPHRHAHAFREALGGGLLIVLLLAALRLYTSALIAAVTLLPLLYLLYLYEVEVYEHEPLAVLAATFLSGILLGVGYALIVGHAISGTINGTQQGVLVSGVLLPLILQIAMVATPLWLINRPHFSETLDGLTFGVATALGFTLSSVLTGYWHILTAPLQGSAAASTGELLSLLRAGVLVAVVNACTTGLITAAVWHEVHGRDRGRPQSPWRGLRASVAIAFLAQVGLGMLSYAITSLLLLVAVWAVAAAALLVWLRVVLHHALLEEGADLDIGEASACPECHRLVPTMRFCPACGLARSAGPKHARSSAAKGVPDAG